MKIIKRISSWIGLVAFCFLLLNYVFWVVFVPTGSMEPSIKSHTRHICWRLPYALGRCPIERGDIVVFKSEVAPYFVMKRVIGLPGERVEINDGVIYIDHHRLDEPYILEPASTYMEDYAPAVFDVPANHVFLLGDNREHSKDSRFWEDHYVSAEQICARVLW